MLTASSVAAVLGQDSCAVEPPLPDPWQPGCLTCFDNNHSAAARLFAQLRQRLAARVHGQQPNATRLLTAVAAQGSLPRTVKGTVQRGKAEVQFAADLSAIKRYRAGPNPLLLSSAPLSSWRRLPRDLRCFG